MAIWTPLALLGLLVAVQVAVWCVAELDVAYSADHAVQTARVRGGTAGAGTADGRAVLSYVGGDLVHDPQISARRDAATATVRISGTALQVLPFVRLPVSATATAPVEALAP